MEMAHGCGQEGRLGSIEQAIHFFQKAEERREAREQRMILAMETIASQGEILRSHADTLSRHDRENEELFNRLRTLELAPGRTLSRLSMIVLTSICGSVGGVVTAIILAAVKGA